MSLKKCVYELLFPPRCPGCGSMMPPSSGERITPYLCRDCRSAWEYATLAQCPTCFAAYRDCTCAPYVLQRTGCKALVKLVPYDGRNDLHTAQRIVLSVKRRAGRRGFSFFAEELCEGLKKALAEPSEKQAFSHTVVAHLPRTKRNFKQYGFDQAQGIAKALAKRMELPFVKALCRVHDGKEQKTLSLQQRHANVKGAFAIRLDLADTRVVLVDDVVTTGAGMAEAVRVLKKAGAAEVVAVAVAVTPKKSDHRKIP